MPELTSDDELPVHPWHHTADENGALFLAVLVADRRHLEPQGLRSVVVDVVELHWPMLCGWPGSLGRNKHHN